MISKETGAALETEIESIQQSIQEILSTPIGSRIMRRQFGSNIPNLIDQPMTNVLMLQLYSAIYTPLLMWEDRISIEHIQVSQISAGYTEINLQAVHMSTDQSINLNIPLQMGAVL